ncbi:hypothetical protein DL98DRAFT_659298 [Cadophora sp. DSE1049]|nr:hypothetical protein DL98DRAFT_659298 [Cadophora sp. DSE1049]
MGALDFLHAFESREAEPDILQAKWYIMAAVALGAAHKGQYLPELYQYASRSATPAQRLLIQRRIKEALVKGAVLYGIPRAGQALGPLFDSLPAEEIDRFAPRTAAADDAETRSARSARGKKYFDTLWNPGPAQDMRDRLLHFCPDHYYTELRPDLLNVRTIYELWISEDAVLTNVETQMCNTALLTCLDCPTQVLWHTRGIVRHGGSLEQARFAQDLGLAVAKEFGCNTGQIKMVDEIEF